MDYMPDRARVVRLPADGGTLTTRPITFTGEHLFVNADVSSGQLRAEVLDESGNVMNALRAGVPATKPACPVLCVLGENDTDITQ